MGGVAGAALTRAYFLIHCCVVLWGVTAILGKLIALPALPLVIFGSVSVMTPHYFAGVADDPLFRPMVGGIILLTVLELLRRRSERLRGLAPS